MTLKHLLPTSKPLLNLDFANSLSLDPRITFSRSSIGTYVDKDGIVQTGAVDEPRFDHDPVTGESLGLLIEESRTNLVNSPTLSYPPAGVNLTLETNVLNPSGTYSNVGRIQCTATLDGHGISAGGAVSYTSGSGVNSIFVKKGNHRYVGLESRSNLGGGYTTLYFDFDTEQIIGNNAGFIKYPNGWYRIFSTYNYNGNASTYGFRMLGSMSFFQWTATGNEFVYFWGPQLEAGSFPTSYIPTTSSAVTRSADIATIEGTNFSSWYNQSEGTVYVDFDKATTERQQAFAISDGTQVNRMSVYYSNDIVVSYIGSPAGGYDQSVYTASSPLLSSEYILGYSSGNTGPAIDGNLGTVITEPNLPTNTTLFLGRREVGDALYMLNGHISRLAYYPTRLSNEQLQTLTA